MHKKKKEYSSLGICAYPKTLSSPRGFVEIWLASLAKVAQAYGSINPLILGGILTIQNHKHKPYISLHVLVMVAKKKAALVLHNQGDFKVSMEVNSSYHGA